MREAIGLMDSGRTASRRDAWRLVLTALLLLSGCSEPPGSPAPQSDSAQPATPEVPTLERVRSLEVLVEGQREQRPAQRWDSPQGYAIYVLPLVVMTAEEPGRDQAFARVDGEFFVRIERLDPATDVAALERNAREWLSGIGVAERLDAERVPHPFLRDAEFVLRAAGNGVSGYIAVIGIGEGLFRFTMHLPHREPLEGMAPTFWAMLQSIELLPVAWRSPAEDTV